MAALRWHASGGKLILLGEHAVVYGAPAVVLGGRRGARARATLSRGDCLRLGGKRHEVVPRPASTEAPVVSAFRASLSAARIAGVDCEVELDVPPGVGLGASAAIAVAVARALLSLVASSGAGQGSCRPLDSRRVLEVAGAWESVFHGNASGVDTAAAVTPGLLWFRRGQGAVSIESLGAPTAVVAVADTPASTRRMVEMVAAQRRAQRAAVDRCFEQIGDLAQRARNAARLGAWSTMGGLMDENHRLLQGLDLSTEALDAACDTARAAGAFGAKLTGAGGGGCVVALCDATGAPSVVEALCRKGYRAFAFE